MKHLYLIGGTMGIGKTTACQLLKRKLRNAVFLDGDWCWDADPFQVTAETKAMVIDNICHLLNNFIQCPAYDNIIFGWVMHEQTIIDSILSKVETSNCYITNVSLICDSHILRQRLQLDIDAGIRKTDAIERSLARIPLYNDLKTVKVDVSNFTPEQTADKIVDL